MKKKDYYVAGCFRCKVGGGGRKKKPRRDRRGLMTLWCQLFDVDAGAVERKWGVGKGELGIKTSSLNGNCVEAGTITMESSLFFGTS